jgi:hypothetical protein
MYDTSTDLDYRKMAKYAQIFLICFYLLLAALFSRDKRMWPVSLYYVGCFVKDFGVFALAFFKLGGK